MKRWRATVGLLLAGCALSLQGLAQSGQETATIRQEIEIMKGILNTSLSQSGDARRRGPGSNAVIEGFHLPGQGTTFLLRAPRFPVEFGFQLDQLGDQIRELTAREFSNAQFAESMARLAAANVAAIEKRLELDGFYDLHLPDLHELRFRFPEPPEPPEIPEPPKLPDPPDAPAAAPPHPDPPPAPPTAPAPRARLDPEQTEQLQKEIRERMDRLRLNLEEVRERAGERKARAERERQELIDALLAVAAQYGDTMTHLGESEYLNFVLLSTDRFSHPMGVGATSELEVISMKKSDITEARRQGLGVSGLRYRVTRQ